MTQKETAIYAFLNNLINEFNECPHSSDSYRKDIQDLLNNIELKYPGTKNAIVTGFLEILPSLREKYKK